MKAIEQTTLTVQDITEHHDFLERERCVSLFLPANRRQEIADRMLERFVDTFLPEVRIENGI